MIFQLQLDGTAGRKVVGRPRGSTDGTWDEVWDGTVSGDTVRKNGAFPVLQGSEFVSQKSAASILTWKRPLDVSIKT
jgi:hypothetical protein